MATFYGRYGRSSQPVALFSAPPAVALGAPPSLALRAPPAVALRGLGATPVVALGSAPVVALGYFGAANPGETESDCRARVMSEMGLSETGANYYCTSSDGSGGSSSVPVSEEKKKEAEEKTKSWSADDWAKIFASFGVLTKPVFDSLGKLIDPNTGKPVPLSPEMQMMYKLFLEQQKNKMPSWVVPAAILGGIAVIALVVMKK